MIRAAYHGKADRARAGVRYLSHREEQLPDGRKRELYGLGPRYRELRGDEAAIASRLAEDGRGLRRPVYYQLKLTVNDRLASRLLQISRSSERQAEWALRDAVEKTMRGARREAQGVYVLHAHGGRGRRHGHPHAHVHLSPLRTDGRPVRPMRPDELGRLRERWGRELERALTRHERRRDLGPVRPKAAPSRLPRRERLARRPSDRGAEPRVLPLVRSAP